MKKDKVMKSEEDAKSVKKIKSFDEGAQLSFELSHRVVVV